MNSFIEKNPFSIYDFLGYFFPGTIILIFIAVISSGDIDNFENFDFKSILQSNIFIDISFTSAIFFIVFSYILGHIISYTSSLTVEKFSLWCYGYPSEFLLDQRRNTGFWSSFITTSGTTLNSLRQLISSNDSFVLTIITHTLIKILVSTLLLPISLGVILCNFLHFKEYIVRPLDKFIISAIYKKLEGLLLMLGLHSDKTNVESDFIKIIYHYYIHKSNNGILMQKLNNYVALYGFLRSLALSLDILTIFSYIMTFLSDNISVLIPITFNIFAFIVFLAYIKFYRRYSLEIFMYLATDEEIKVDTSGL